VLKKIAWGAAGLLLVASMALEFGATRAYAAKVDCDKVMAEVNAGKKGTEVAKDLGISSSSVYRCKKKARAKAAAGSAGASSSPAAASPAAGASPASAASPGTAKPKKHKKATSAASPSPTAAASPGM
jgi:hypothetical protein